MKVPNFTRFHPEVIQTLVKLQTEIERGFEIDGFYQHVLMLAMRLQELRNEGFTGSMEVHFKDGHTRIEAERRCKPIAELRQRYGIIEEADAASKLDE